MSLILFENVREGDVEVLDVPPPRGDFCTAHEEHHVQHVTESFSSGALSVHGRHAVSAYVEIKLHSGGDGFQGVRNVSVADLILERQLAEE